MKNYCDDRARENIKSTIKSLKILNKKLKDKNITVTSNLIDTSLKLLIEAKQNILLARLIDKDGLPYEKNREDRKKEKEIQNQKIEEKYNFEPIQKREPSPSKEI